MPKLTPRVTSLVVSACWAVMTLQAFVYVGKYGSNVPYWDDWLLVPGLVESGWPSWYWFWEQDNEHRMPLVRLALLGLIRLSGFDFRVPMFCSVVVLAVLAFSALRAAARLRGEPAMTDVVFPLLLLHAGHGENLLWSWQLSHILLLAFVVGALLLMLTTRKGLGPRTALLIGLTAAALPLCGAPGVAYVPPLLAWLALGAWRTWQDQAPYAGRTALAALAAGALATLAAAPYLAGQAALPPIDAGTFGQTIVQFLSLGFVPGIGFHPDLARLGPSLGVFVGLLITLAAAAGVKALYRGAATDLRLAGLLLLLGGFLLLCAGTALRRPGLANQTYYGLYLLPALMVSFFLVIGWARPPLRGLIAGSLAAAASVALWFNTWQGIDLGRIRRARLEAFEADLRRGTSLHVLLARHTQSIWPLTEGPDRIADHLLLLHTAGVGEFARMGTDPAFQTEHIPPRPDLLHQATWEKGQITTSSEEGNLSWKFDPPRYVAGVQFDYATESAILPTMRASWVIDGPPGPLPLVPYIRRLYGEVWSAPEGGVVTIWIAAPIAEFRLYPDLVPTRGRLRNLRVLLPASAD